MAIFSDVGLTNPITSADFGATVYINLTTSIAAPTEYRFLLFKDSIDGQAHFALTKGEIKADKPTLVHVHLENTFRDLLFSQRESVAKWPMASALEKIGQEGGVLVLLGIKLRC